MTDTLLTTFTAARLAGTPLIAITTQEPASLMLRLQASDTAPMPTPFLSWDLMRGLVPLNRAAELACRDCLQDVELALLTNPPEALGLALRLPPESVVFVLQAHRYLANEAVSQALWNLRDPYMSNGRTVVLLGPDFTFPAELSQDLLVLDDPLPDTAQLQGIISDTYTAGELPAPTSESLPGAVQALRGLSSFAAEQVCAMSLTRGGIDVNALWARKRALIDATPGLTVERGRETFRDIGGQEAIKGFATAVMQGRQPPTVIVRVEELDKVMGGARTDTSGVSQDAHKTLLNAMEDEDYTGLIAVGPPGSGKSLFSKALGNTYNVLSISLDLGALKGGLVGQSEQAVRTAIRVINNIAGRGGALWVATCNQLDVLPPELQRRFRLGVWFWDLPSEEERRQIWALCETRYELPNNPELRPDDTSYTGSDIRNVCEIAWRLNCSLVEATRYVVPVAVIDTAGIENLRRIANGRFLSANTPGVYRVQTVTVERKRRVNLGEGK
jgi:hypothetical protein